MSQAIPSDPQPTDDEGEVLGYAFSGIGALIAVTQMKVDNANQDAMDGATKQSPPPPPPHR